MRMSPGSQPIFVVLSLLFILFSKDEVGNKKYIEVGLLFVGVWQGGRLATVRSDS